MWDCRHHRVADDFCTRRKKECFPGGVACALKGKYIFPLRRQEDQLLKSKTAKKDICAVTAPVPHRKNDSGLARPSRKS
jgi:hypothetical protein